MRRPIVSITALSLTSASGVDTFLYLRRRGQGLAR